MACPSVTTGDQFLAQTLDHLDCQAQTLGSFGFHRDEYFAHITWKTRDGRPMSHTMDVGAYLRALMRDVAWGFFYGWVNFDEVIGTRNHYGKVDAHSVSGDPFHRRMASPYQSSARPAGTRRSSIGVACAKARRVRRRRGRPRAPWGRAAGRRHCRRA